MSSKIPPNKKIKEARTSKLNESTTNSIVPPTPEMEQQFEAELCWCIQQLQFALKNGKLNKKQVQDHTKALNTLMSNMAPMIKKRQIMRLSFGDYRAKMAAEEKRYSKSSLHMKVKPAAPSKKSLFVKKANCISSTKGTFPSKSQHLSSEDLSNGIENVKIAEESHTQNSNNLVFIPSDNCFRFNFES